MPKSQASCSSNSRRRSTKFCKFIPFIHTNTSRQVCFLKGISYKELYKATDGFRRIMTCDSQSITYEAKFEDGSASIVKEVRSVDRSNEVFDKELQCLGRLHHRHVVALRGFSIGRRSFLIFENTAKGSLKEHLNDPLKTPLSWKTRVQIAIGVAAALFFCEAPIRHISIDSSDIILDDKLVPKLSNISCLCSEEKADMIPQFGALLLELITGQSLAKESADVIQWIQELRSNLSMHNMIDPDLGNSYSSKELWDLLSVARLCMKVQNTQAFSISQIFWYLQKRFGNN
ncbi:probable receptor-like protein kinase At1g49730 isoform X2 [Beta vulgaris subsp. vulgaris]|uniref:probable receptor-like protein kinase At1g49730 isoform X2 n=1 Tax=Beta vulgaris subsp. vulgaris TaxID=3555 RepID=UPI002036BD2A|nr:probable receptor-like protein kinase At1g49730 isoform X2 [Beta vulgaris subsp. vulgaris]